MEALHFVYINGRGQIAAHSVSQPSHSEIHFQGLCIDSRRIKTYRKDRVLAEFATAEEALQACSNFIPTDYQSRIASAQIKKQTFDVCFTGFKKADKERLIALAGSNGLTVRSSVTQNLQLLCCGDNAGPTKVASARMKGIVILEESGFVNFLETGEIPEG